MLLEVVEHLGDHACEPHGVGPDGGELLDDVEGWVLMADAGAVEIEVATAKLADEGAQLFGGIGQGHVDTLGGYDIEILTLDLDQQMLTTSGDAYLPAFGCQDFHDFEPDARGGSDDDGTLG